MIDAGADDYVRKLYGTAVAALLALVVVGCAGPPAEREPPPTAPLAWHETPGWQRWFVDLEKARTKADLVVFVGSVPRCEPLWDGREACEFRMGREAFIGDSTALSRRNLFGRTSKTYRPPDRKQIGFVTIVTCIIPTDGSDREPESCTARRE